MSVFSNCEPHSPPAQQLLSPQWPGCTAAGRHCLMDRGEGARTDIYITHSTYHIKCAHDSCQCHAGWVSSRGHETGKTGGQIRVLHDDWEVQSRGVRQYRVSHRPLYSTFYIVCNRHYTLYIAHYTLCIIHYTI